MSEPLIGEFMTLQPQTIEGKETIDKARELMTKFSIRHLPVTLDGIVAGMLSEREANLALGIESIDPSQLLVIDVCSERPYIVHPDTPLRVVAETMAKKHFGSAIVMENAKLVGIFTTVDACRTLADVIEGMAEHQSLEIIRLFRKCV